MRSARFFGFNMQPGGIHTFLPELVSVPKCPVFPFTPNVLNPKPRSKFPIPAHSGWDASIEPWTLSPKGKSGEIRLLVRKICNHMSLRGSRRLMAELLHYPQAFRFRYKKAAPTEAIAEMVQEPGSLACKDPRALNNKARCRVLKLYNRWFLKDHKSRSAQV